MAKVWRRPRSWSGVLLAGGLVFLAWPGHGLAQTAPIASVAEDRTAATLRARIGPPHDDTVKAYVAAGATETKPHVLTDREWKWVERAIADLPAQYRQVLERRLGRLSFIDAPSSMGTALTRTFDGPNGEPMSDITIRAEVLEQSLSDFLTQKEALVFYEDGSGYSVRVSAGRMSALSYILLHETAHVMDRAFDITQKSTPFGTIWTDYRRLAQPYAADPISQTTYRRQPKLPASQAPTLYRALGQAPFVSLYSTASAGEDFAELLAWRELSARFETSLKIQVLDGRGVEVVSVEPLKSPAVRARLEAAQAALAKASAAALDQT